MKKEMIQENDLNGNSLIWRYLDFPKFVNLLQKSSLFLSRADRFEDKFEGSFTPTTKAFLEKYYRENNVEFTFDQFKTSLKKAVFINCWHISASENMAMWKIYGNSSGSIAITSLVNKLEMQLKNHTLSNLLRLTKVEYIDHFGDPTIDTSKYTNLFTYKLIPYYFEQEVRIIGDFFPIPEVLANPAIGWELDVNLHELIQSIIVSPESPEWFYSVAEGICEKYGFKHLLQRSALSKEPM
jgi:hypothetical protein